MTTQCVQVKLEFGHFASLRCKPSPDGFTHDWCLFVRGAEGNDIHHFVEKVIFNLHDSFPKPRRVVKEPPFQLEESGYGGFTMSIEIHLKNKEEPKKVQFVYDLFLHVDGEPPIDHVRGEKLTFRNPTEDFRRKLLLAGGVGVLDDGGIPPGATFGLESMGVTSSTGSIENRAASKGKPGAVSVAQKKLKSSGAPTKDPNKTTSSKFAKEAKEGKGSTKDSKSSSKNALKLASKRPSSSASSDPTVKRKKEHSTSTKAAKSKSSSEKSSLNNEQPSKKGPSTAKKKKSLPKEKKPDLFAPEITVEHKVKPEPIPKPTLPPFEDELSTGEMEEPPDSPSSKSTGSFSSLPRGRGTGGALETLMAEIADDNEDEEDQEYNIPFQRDFPTPPFQSLDNDSSSSGSDFDQIIRSRKMNKSKTPEKVTKKETVEKKNKAQAKTKSSESKKSWTKQKENTPKSKPSEVKKKAERGRPSTKNKAPEKKEPKTVESKTKPSSEAKMKKTEKLKNDAKKRSVDGKSKVIEGKCKSDARVKSSEAKSKENTRDLEKKREQQANNMDYLYELVDLHKRLMALKDREKLQKVVDLIGETGDFKITDKTFDFDLCSLDKPTVRKLQEYVPPL